MRRPAYSWIANVLLGAWLSLACSKAGDSSGPTPKPSASALRPSVPSAASSLAEAKPNSTPPGCRALEVIGRATVEGVPLETNAVLDGAHWVELDAGASVSLRHMVTTRELKLLGPAKVLPCRGGAEQLLLATGQLTTSANFGVRPGAEVLIATPQGTVRYGDAALDIDLGVKGLRVRVKQGEAWVEPEARGTPHFKNPVRSGGEARLGPHLVPASELVSACQAAAQASAESATRVLESGAAAGASGGSLGERAATHMRARGKARIACAVAAAAVGALPEAAERQTLSASVAHADELWQRVPHAISGQKN